MKIRNGFVSNSSSSSFIVMFDKRPESVDELKDMMFPQYDMETKLDYYGDPESVRTIVETVFSDIEKQENSNIDSLSELIREFESSYSTWDGKLEADRNEYVYSDKELTDKIREKVKEYSPIQDEYFEKCRTMDRNSTEFKAFMKKYSDMQSEINDMLDELSKKDLEKFLEENENKYIAYFEYSDNDGNLSSLMEHYGIFENVKNIYINNH